MNPPPPLGLREKLSYGFGDLASVLYWQTFMVYLLYFYTDVFGITAAAAGTMFLVNRIWDGVNDPLMGIVSDRTETRWGKFRPYLLWMSVPFAVAGVFTFTTPDFDSSGKLIYAYLTFGALMMLYTAINIPYTAMLGVMTPDAKERTSLSSIKFLFAFSAGTIVSFTLLPMVKALGGGDEGKGWQLSFVVYGIAFVLFFFVAFAGTRERVRPPRAQKTSVARDLQDLMANRPWMVLLATTVTFILFVATRGTAKAHWFKYYIGSHDLALPFTSGVKTYGFEELVSAYNGLGQLGSVAGVLLLPWFVGRVGKKPAFIILFVIAIFCTAVNYVLKPDQLGLIFGFEIIGSATGGPLSALIWAMYADTADYAEWRSHRRATGLIFSASTMAQKFGWAFGSATAGWLMTMVGFQANVAQTPEAQHGILLLVSLIPAAVGVLSILIILVYPLNEAKVAEIETELKARRAAEGEPEAGATVAQA
jgi:GPH family glycoside/pentoside/hexuronide:cation symporter